VPGEGAPHALFCVPDIGNADRHRCHCSTSFQKSSSVVKRYSTSVSPTCL
jgi:hypothetical protein